MNYKHREIVNKIPKAVKPLLNNPNILVSRRGRVFINSKGVWYEVHPTINKGRFRVLLGDGNPQSLSRILAMAWIPNPKPKEYNVVRHLDDNPLNNRLSNLAWGTQKMNMRDCIRNGNFKMPLPRRGKLNNLYGKRGSNHPRSVITKEVSICIKYLIKIGYSVRFISRLLLLHTNSVTRFLKHPENYTYDD